MLILREILPFATAATVLAATWLFPAMASCGGKANYAWIGNSAPVRSVAIPSAVTDLWVDRDGTAYGILPGELGSPNLIVCRKTGTEVLALGEGFVISGNRTHLFIATHGGVSMIPKPREGQQSIAEDEIAWLRCPDLPVEGYHEVAQDGFAIRGLHATEKYLYVSHTSHNRVERWNLAAGRITGDWHVPMPGALAQDPWKGLWVISGAGSSDPGAGFAGEEQLHGNRNARVIRLDLERGRLLEELAGPVMPTALTVTMCPEYNVPVLLVADNGPAQQVLRFSRREPGRTRSLNSLGNHLGLLGSVEPGGMNNRFCGLTGLGVAVDGTLVVAQNWMPFMTRRADYKPQCAEILAFAPGGEVRFQSQALVKGDAVAIYPEAPYDIYTGIVKLETDWWKPAMDWRLAGRTDHPFLMSDEQGRLTFFEKRFFCSVLGVMLHFGVEQSTLRVFRQNPSRYGNALVPVAAIRVNGREETAWTPWKRLPRRIEERLREESARAVDTGGTVRTHGDRPMELEQKFQEACSLGWMWVDGRGAEPLDARVQEDEIELLEICMENAVWSVDASGGLWTSGNEYDLYRGLVGPRMISWFPERIDPNGIPVYRRRESHRLPVEFTLGRVLWHKYDDSDDSLLLAGETPLYGDDGVLLACLYKPWVGSTIFAEEQRRAQMLLLGACNSSGDRNNVSDGFFGSRGLEATDRVDNWLFLLRDDPLQVAVYDLRLGNRVTTLHLQYPASLSSRKLSKGSLQAVKSAEGNILLAVTLQGVERLMAINWTPPADIAETVASPPCLILGSVFDERIELCWGMADAGIIKGYKVYRAEADGVFEPVVEDVLESAFFTDTDLENGQTYRYVVSVINAAGESALSEPIKLAPNKPVVRFAGEDRVTLGGWKGRYGSLGYFLFGEKRDDGVSGNPLIPVHVSGPPSGIGLGEKNGETEPVIQFDPALPQRLDSKNPTEHEGLVGFLRVTEQEAVVFPLSIRDGSSLRAGFYCGSSEKVNGVRIEFLNPETGQVLAEHEFSNETEPEIRGRYLSWDITGSVMVRLSPPRAAAMPDQCGINALFFDPALSQPLN